MVDWFEKMTFGVLPDRAADKFGEREALYFKGHRWSFNQLARDIDRTAKGLIDLGIQPGDKVSLWVPNRPEFIHFFFAITKIGAIVVPINTFLRSADTSYLLKQSNSITLITVDQSGPVNYLSMVYEMLPSIQGARKKEISDPEYPDLKRVVILSDRAYDGTYFGPEVLKQGEKISDDELNRRSDAADPDGTVLITYTSGTTGFPKGVMHCHNIIRNITDQANRLGVTFLDVIIMYLPLFHVFGLYKGVLMSMVTGARQVLTERFDPTESMALIEQERVTLIHGFDTHFKDLIEVQGKDPKDVGSLRTGLLATGMSSSIPIAQKAHRVLCPGLVSGFGMSEIGVGACLSFLTSSEEQRSEASGFPSPGYEVKIINPETGQEQPKGVSGEIIFRGYGLMQGYYNKPEETTKAVDRDGWLHTGDMGIMRQDGHLRFIGRFKEMLKTGGENVDPMEVEAYLLNHPAVNQVAIVGYPDERLSEVGVAFIRPEPGEKLTSADVTDFCKGKIASFKIPRHIIFVNEFPMTASGKIKKMELKEIARKKIYTA
ncbi:AMP-binding protein [Thermodesulfobacteriota bacterium]